MNQELLLVNAITLLYRESQLLDSPAGSAELIRPLLEQIKLPEVNIGQLDTERDRLVELKELCLQMCDADAGRQYIAPELLQKLRHATKEDESLYESFRTGIEQELNEKDLKLYCVNLRQSIRAYVNELKIREIMKDAAYKLQFKRDQIPSLKTFIAEVAASLEKYRGSDNQKNASIVGEVDFEDIEGLTHAAHQMDDLISDEGIMRLGWQGINRMTQGGIRRGEFVVVPALQHNFKTGFTLSIFKQLALYNKPFMLDKTGRKKPLLVHYSFENQLGLNLPFLYRNIYENKTLQEADLNTPREIMAQYMSENLRVNGYEVKMYQINPTNFTYTDLFDHILQLEAEGYEIHAIVCDYLNLMSKKGCDADGPTGSIIRDLFRRVRNFCMPKKITFITPHQLSTDAKKHIREGMDQEFLEQIANKGYYDGCKTIDQEVDLELNIHIVKEDGRSWLMVQRGKHRLIKQTKPEYLACTLLFENVGDIRDDINGPDTTRKRPGGNPIGSRNEAAFYQQDYLIAA